MGLLFHLFFLCFLGHAGAGQETVELLNLYETTEDISQQSSHSDAPIAVSVSSGDLNAASSSILSAESWLRSHVLAYYPATKITTIVVGNSVLCQRDQDKKFGLVLPSLKNVYHSLRRWGLEKDIKVSVPLYLDCLHPNSASYEDDLRRVKPLIDYLRSVNSTYSVIPHSGFSHFSDNSLGLESLKKIEFFDLNNVNVIAIVTRGRRPITRTLSAMDSNLIGPFPVRPTPLPEIAEPPLHSSVGYPAPANVAPKPMPPLPEIAGPPLLSSVGYPAPANVARKPMPPPAQIGSPTPMHSSFAPELPPSIVPASSPRGSSLPPCNPIDNGSPKPKIGPVQKLWCVAKPSVPAETLQQAMDYACGEGGVDCKEITPQGNCYNPDTVVAHASYAFNSYWQKHKRNGGTCSFGGTAMLINSDPSFLHCRFVLS